MSPEFFDPGKFNLKDNRQTKHSDCYALGMVMYEVLSGRAPFSGYHGLAIIGAIIKGERPRRPRGEERKWFADDIWSVMERCWKPSPSDRPSIKDVLQCLEKASKSWTPPSSREVASTRTKTLSVQGSDSSAEESTGESEVASPSRVVPSQLLNGEPNANNICSPVYGFSALSRTAPGHQDPEMSVTNPNGSGSDESAGVPERVSWAGGLNDFWC